MLAGFRPPRGDGAVDRGFGMLLALPGLQAQHLKTTTGHANNPYYSNTDTTHLHVSDATWKKILSPARYSTARQQATEKAFTGQYLNQNAKGTYYCAV